mgnify:CR=1 FL=1
MKKVGIIMGSDSDLPIVQKTIDTLKNYGNLKLDTKNYSGSGELKHTQGFAHISINNQTDKPINVNKLVLFFIIFFKPSYCFFTIFDIT